MSINCANDKCNMFNGRLTIYMLLEEEFIQFFRC